MSKSRFTFLVVYFERSDNGNKGIIELNGDDFMELASLPDGTINVYADCYDRAFYLAHKEAVKCGSVRAMMLWNGSHDTVRNYEKNKHKLESIVELQNKVQGYSDGQHLR